MKKFRKGLALVLALALCLSMFNIGVYADETEETTEGSDSGAAVVVARLNGVEYTSLKDVIDVANGRTVTLLSDVDLTGEESNVTVPEGTITTLDLNGYSIKVDNDGDIVVNGNLTLKDSKGEGKIYSTTDYATGHASGVISVYGTFKMESGYIYAVRDDASKKGQFGVTWHDNATVNISGGKIEAGWFALAGNGNNKEGSPKVNISGGTLVSTADYAINIPDNATVSISGAALVDGASGAVSVNNGSLNVSGGTLVNQGTGNTGDWKDGTGGQTNATINVNAKYGNSEVAISGGTLISSSDAPIITTGTAHTAEVSITGGNFNKDVSKYLAKWYTLELQSDGSYSAAKIAGTTGPYEGKLEFALNDLSVSPGVSTTTSLSLENNTDEEISISGLEFSVKTEKATYSWFQTQGIKLTRDHNDETETLMGDKEYYVTIPAHKSATLGLVHFIPDSELSPGDVVSVSVSSGWGSVTGTSDAIKIGAATKSYTIPYTVTLNNEDTTKGKAEVNKTTARKGDEVTVSVTPNAGYTAVVNVVDANGTSVSKSEGDGGNYTFSMPDSNVTVNVTYTAIQYDIHTSNDGHGTLTVKDTATVGEKVQITVEPEAGYTLDGLKVTYYGGGSTIDVDANNSFVMPAASVQVDATFKEASYKVTVNTDSNGTATPSTEYANYKQQITITTTPGYGYELDKIKVDGTELGEGESSFSMPDKDVTVEVSFKKATYKIGVEQSSVGKIDVATEAEYQSTVEVKATPDTGYEVESIKVRLAGKSDEVKVTNGKFTMPGEDVEVSVTFRLIDYTITNNGGTNGNLDVKTTANMNETVTITPTPNAGYELGTITVVDKNNNTVKVDDNKFTMPASNVTVSATFVAIDYTITLVEPENGTYTAKKGGTEVKSGDTVHVGDEITIDTTPDDGYELAKVVVTDANGNDVTVTDGKFTMPAGSVTVSVRFQVKADIAFIDYAYAGDGYKLMLVGSDSFAKQDSEGGNVSYITYDGNYLFFISDSNYSVKAENDLKTDDSTRTDAYWNVLGAYIVPSDLTKDEARAQLAVLKLTSADAASQLSDKIITRNGDVTRNDVVNAGDWAAITDMLGGVSAPRSVVQRLEADTDTAADADKQFGSIADAERVVNIRLGKYTPATVSGMQDVE